MEFHGIIPQPNGDSTTKGLGMIPLDSKRILESTGIHWNNSKWNIPS
jgi:hypothetical protein